MGPEAFGAYFLAGDVFVGVVMGGRGADLGADRVSRVHEAAASVMSASETEGERTPLGETPLTLEDAQDNRDWAACVGGVYYVRSDFSLIPTIGFSTHLHPFSPASSCHDFAHISLISRIQPPRTSTLDFLPS